MIGRCSSKGDLGFPVRTPRSAWKRTRRMSRFWDLGARMMRPLLVFVTCVVLTLPGRASGQPPAVAGEPWDILIRGGRIVDGTGNPWFDGDLAIRGDRIAAMGHLDPGAKAGRVIEAGGLVVAPGFIDIHSHSDMPLLADGDAPSKIRQGVTTEVLGEGSSAGPAKGKQSAASFTGTGNKATWTTLGGYFD